MNKTEYVEVTVRVPKSIVEFLKLCNEDIKEYIEAEVPGWVGASMESGEWSEELLNEAIEKTNVRTTIDPSYLLWLK